MARLPPLLPLHLLFLCVALVVTAGCGGGGATAEVGGGPVVQSVEPGSGAMDGDTPIVIRGTGLANQAPGKYQLLIGGQPAARLVVVDDTKVTCATPPGALGAVDLEIITARGSTVVPAAFMYYPPPTVTSITPATGNLDGGFPVTVEGSGFAANDPGTTNCLIGLKMLTNIEIIDDSTLTGFTPSSWSEAVKEVVVQNRNGSDTLAAAYKYTGPPPEIDSLAPAEGTWTGGTEVTITGEFFTETGGDLRVRFGDVQVPGTRVDDGTNTMLTCTTPPSDDYGPVDVTVENENGENMLANAFEYIPVPILASIEDNEGPYAGGEDAEITGKGFQAAGAGTTFVTIGGTPVTNLSIESDTLIRCKTPVGSAAGPVDVVVANDHGVGVLSGGYTYLIPDFWWEDTYGTAVAGTGYLVSTSVAIPNGFPFFGTNWTSVYAVCHAHLDFGAYDSNWSTSHQLFAFPHITAAGQILNLSAAFTMYSTNHLPDRTVVTWDRVPEYSTAGSNSVQIHLHESGIFAIVYKGVTFHIGGNNPYGLVAVNPGSGTSVTVDWTSGPHSGGPTDALNETFSGVNDLSNSVLTFLPNASGGYDSWYTPGVPVDPDP